MDDLAIVLGVAAITALIFQRLKQPSILGYLAAGLIVGPYLPVPLFANSERVHALSEFGVVLVMFSVGLEFRLKKFLTVLPIAGATGIVEIGTLMTIGYLLGISFGWSDIKSVFLGACLSISSTMTVSKILEQRPIPEHNRQFVLGILVIQDVAAIALIAVMTAIAGGKQASVTQVFSILGKLTAALLAIIAAGMFFVPRLVRVLERTKNKEVLVVGATGICFSFAMLAEAVGYSSALGAFIGGILVAESGLGHRVETATASVRDMFVAVFFVSIGMSVDPVVAWDTLPTSLLVLGAIVVTQLFSVSLAGIASGNGVNASITSGLALGQIGEFAFIIGAIGTSVGILGAEFQAILVTVAVLSTLSTSVLLGNRQALLSLVHRLIPERLERVLSLYESWWRQLRTKSEPKHAVRRIVVGLLLDLFVMCTILLSWEAWRDEIGKFLVGAFDLGEEFAHTVSALALGAALLPLLLPLIFGARSLAMKLAARLFADQKSSASALFTTAIVAFIVAGFGLPWTLLLGNALGIAYVWPSFLLALALSLGLLWKRIGSLESDLRSGGLMMLRAVADQGFREAHEDTRLSLPGVGDLLPVLLSENSYALGKTLAELELRTHTGGRVVALKSSEGSIEMPIGTEPLDEGLTLFLAGTTESQQAAKKLLLRGPGDGTEDREPPLESEKT